MLNKRNQVINCMDKINNIFKKYNYSYEAIISELNITNNDIINIFLNCCKGDTFNFNLTIKLLLTGYYNLDDIQLNMLYNKAFFRSFPTYKLGNKLCYIDNNENLDSFSDSKFNEYARKQSILFSKDIERLTKKDFYFSKKIYTNTRK